MNALFQPIRFGDLDCRNRIAMAPCTRCQSPGFVPTEAVAAYYERRAADGVGLIISEGTVICERGNGYPGAPGIFASEQIEAWKRVTQRVHDAGGRMICQIWHVGAVAHPVTTGGALPEGPAGISPDGEIKRLRDEDGQILRYGPTEAVDETRIRELIDLYRQAAAHALEAGFDGVEIHGAHTYLIDQFLNLHFNRREDEWGGPHRARFAAEVARAVIAEIGAGRTVFRFSPKMSVVGIPWSRPAETFTLLLDALREAGLRLLHASNMDFDEEIVPIEAVPVDRREGLPVVEGHVRLAAATRACWDGGLIGVGSLTPERAARAIADGEIDMAAFGRSLIANPDFVSRVREGKELAPYDPSRLGELV